MTVVSAIKGKFKGYLDRKAEEKAYQDRLEQEAKEKERELYREEYKKAAFEAARIRAKRDALKKTGLPKLRAISAQSYKKSGSGGFLSNLSEYTRKNMARQEQNIKRTEALRKAGMEMRKAGRKGMIPINLNKKVHGPLY